MTTLQNRDYIRHPSSIPLDVKPRAAQEQMNLNLKLNNISAGGLSFDSPVPFNEGAIVNIRIPVKPVFRVNAMVEWCKRKGSHYELGVRFLDQEDAYRARMVEQVCHIEQYRQETLRRTGRRLSRNKASLEWIQKHGPRFPH